MTSLSQSSFHITQVHFHILGELFHDFTQTLFDLDCRNLPFACTRGPAQDASGNDGDLSARAKAGQIVMGLWDDDSNADLGYLTPQVLGVVLGPSGSTFIASEPGMNARANPSPGTRIASRQTLERRHGVSPP